MLRRVAEIAAASEQIAQFAQAGSKINISGNCDAIFCPASGARCWGLFCNAMNRPHFPPLDAAAWSTFFAAGRSFQIYVAHLATAWILLGLPASWKTAAVISMDRGAAKSGGKSSPQDQLSPKGSWRNYC